MRRRTLAALAILIGTAASLSADDWPMLGRSASRNPVSLEKNPPVWWHAPDWKDVGTLPSKNVKWQVKLGSHAKGDPVVANGLVWVGTNNSHPRDPEMKDRVPV